MSKTSNAGKWVWNIQPLNGTPFQVIAGQLEVDDNGVHLACGPGHCGGLVASFPNGTLVWREDLPSAENFGEATAPVELVAGELAAFDQSPRVEIGAINITSQSVDLVADIAEAVAKALQSMAPRSVP